MQQKTTVRYRSEFVAKARKIKSDQFRHFIYVKLRTAVDRCKNLPFTCKSAENPQKNIKFICPILDISVSGSPIIQDGERCDRRQWRMKGAERVAAATSLPAASGGVKGKRSVCWGR